MTDDKKPMNQEDLDKISAGYQFPRSSNPYQKPEGYGPPPIQKGRVEPT